MAFRAAVFVGALFTAVSLASGALAWGATGHRLIGRLAVESLPEDLPAFLRAPKSIDAVGELAREPDRDRAAGREHDSDRDPAHFLDLADDGRVLGGPALNALPPTRQAYDTALRAVGSDSWKGGWLPYAIIDSWEQLTKDFAYLRVDTVAAKAAAGPNRRAWFLADLARRRALILRDLGALAHFVGDGSQPLHVTIHYNGWGDYPNPDGFTQGRFHARFEGALVREFMDEASVRPVMTAYRDCRCAIAARTVGYLVATNKQVVPLYQLQKDGAFRGGDMGSRAFIAARLAAGASELRDLVIDAWRSSARSQVGWPSVRVADVEAGAIDPWDSVFGGD